MDKLRLKFAKTGKSSYISHLDLMRVMERAFMRARLPLEYSAGFNPHPKISIALPLPVGCESVCEIMDFSLKEHVDPEDIPGKLNAVMPEGIEVIEAYEAVRKTKEIKWLSVEGRFEYDSRSPDEMSVSATELFSRPVLEVMKKTKRGPGKTDIAGMIREVKIDPGAGMLTVSAFVSAQDPALNPQMLEEALKQHKPEAAPDFAAFRRLRLTDGRMIDFH